MISCTQFIPAYSTLFKFLEEKEGYGGVQAYWEYVSDRYVQPRLGECISKNGLRGCFEYWSHSLNEEAADFTMSLIEDEGIFEIRMHDCPSKGLLNTITHITPYARYCQHCDILYRRVAERYGFDYEFICPQGEETSCTLRVLERRPDESTLNENGSEKKHE